MGVTGVEEAQQPGAAMAVEAFVGLGQQPPAAVQRICFVAPVADRLVLDPPAALVQFGVGQLVHVERVIWRGEDYGVGGDRPLAGRPWWLWRCRIIPVSEAGEEGEQGIGGAVSAGLDVAWSCPVERFLFD